MSDRLSRARWSIAPADHVDDAWWTAWDAINTASFGRHPILQSRMARLLVKYFGDSSLRFASLSEGSRSLARAVVSPDGRGKWRLFCPSQSPVGLMVLDRSVAGDVQLLHRLVRALPGPAFAVALPYQDPEFAWLPANGGDSVERTTLGTTVAIRSRDGFDAYWAARPKELRDNIRRRQRKASEAGLEARLAAHVAPEAIAAAVDRYGELESRGWKGREGTALHPDNVQGRFYREALQTFAATNDASAYELSFGERLAASRLVVSGPAMHVILKVTHDEELRQYAPGHVQLHEILRTVMLAEREPRSVELYTKASRDWLLWATDTRPIDSISVYRSRLVATLVRHAKRLRKPAEQKAEQPAAGE